jgi:hypothetical protein
VLNTTSFSEERITTAHRAKLLYVGSVANFLGGDATPMDMMGFIVNRHAKGGSPANSVLSLR